LKSSMQIRNRKVVGFITNKEIEIEKLRLKLRL
jgi:hypothetical protein